MHVMRAGPAVGAVSPAQARDQECWPFKGKKGGCVNQSLQQQLCSILNSVAVCGMAEVLCLHMLVVVL